MNKISIKTIFLPLFFVACSISVAAQRPQEQRQERQSTRRERTARTAQTLAPLSDPLTSLEELDIKTGAIIVKNYTIIGSVSGFGGTATVTAYEFVDTQSGRKEYGIGVELEESERSERAALERLYVDYDEMESLIKSLDYIIRLEKSATMENFEAQYKTRSDFTMTTFNRATGALRAGVSSGSMGRLRIGMTLGNLADFRKLLVDAKTVLDKIK